MSDNAGATFRDGLDLLRALREGADAFAGEASGFLARAEKVMSGGQELPAHESARWDSRITSWLALLDAYAVLTRQRAAAGDAGPDAYLAAVRAWILTLKP